MRWHPASFLRLFASEMLQFACGYTERAELFIDFPANLDDSLIQTAATLQLIFVRFLKYRQLNRLERVETLIYGDR